MKNSKLSSGVKADIVMKDLLREIDKAQGKLGHQRNKSQKIAPIIIEEEPTVVIDDCITQEGVESQYSKFPLSGLKRTEFHSSSKKFDVQILETILSQSYEQNESNWIFYHLKINIFMPSEQQADLNFIKVPAKEYLFMKDRLSKLKGKVEEVTNDTRRVLGMVEAIHKEPQKNKKYVSNPLKRRL